ncbi:MAG: DUF2156 domain-containing protein [Clostridia bacterium]|nr:DUF2156 domain-containing protein [Clostridia bacterium]
MIDRIERALRDPELSDKEWIRNALMYSGRNGADFCFGVIYMWSPVLGYRIAQVDGMLVVRGGAGSYSLPAGDGDCTELLREMMADTAEPLKLHAVCEYQKQWLEESFPGAFLFTEDRDQEDYIYSVRDLADLSGKKYHGKRNHCSYFEKTYDWTYEEMTGETALECLEYSREWLRQNPDKRDAGPDGEFRAIERALPNFDALDFRGGILRIEGNIVGYTFGEPINDRVFCIHVEKADGSVRGAYPMINREFARNTISDFELVNREEDMGIEGLRRAKLSYHPVELLVKYRAVQQQTTII